MPKPKSYQREKERKKKAFWRRDYFLSERSSKKKSFAAAVEEEEELQSEMRKNFSIHYLQSNTAHNGTKEKNAFAGLSPKNWVVGGNKSPVKLPLEFLVLSHPGPHKIDLTGPERIYERSFETSSAFNVCLFRGSCCCCWREKRHQDLYFLQWRKEGES